jgi:hypothetical protein
MKRASLLTLTALLPALLAHWHAVVAATGELRRHLTDATV